MNETQVKSESSLSDSILRTLAYFDIFQYPLLPEEIYRFLPTNGVTENDVRLQLIDLSKRSVIYALDNFYSIQNTPEIAIRRMNGNAMAVACMPKARRRAALIARFPFVRSVMISGSMSKGFMDADSDVDFFIVTEPRRLWIARMSLVVFKRIFLLNSHKYFCVNYFVDTNSLEIDEKNLFTATELATLVPVVNAEVYQNLISKNSWLRNYFPNYKSRSSEDTIPAKRFWLKSIAERFFNVFFADRIDRYFRNKTLRRWKKIYEKDYQQHDFDVAFKTSEHVSKNHPRNYQRKVIDRYEQKLAALEMTVKSRQSA